MKYIDCLLYVFFIAGSVCLFSAANSPAVLAAALLFGCGSAMGLARVLGE